MTDQSFDSSDIHFVEGQRGSQLLSLGGYTFVKNRTTEDKTYWICSRKVWEISGGRKKVQVLWKLRKLQNVTLNLHNCLSFLFIRTFKTYFPIPQSKSVTKIFISSYSTAPNVTVALSQSSPKTRTTIPLFTSASCLSAANTLMIRSRKLVWGQRRHRKLKPKDESCIILEKNWK